MHLHIDDFYRDASRALLALYRAFPRKTTLYVDELIGHLEPDEYGLPAVRHQSCLGTLLWLGEEGYLRHEGAIRHEGLDQAVLRQKGFLRLSARVPHRQRDQQDRPRRDALLAGAPHPRGRS